MEVEPQKGGVVKTGTKRTHSGELASSPHHGHTPQSSPHQIADSPSPAGGLLQLISQVFKVGFLVSESRHLDVRSWTKAIGAPAVNVERAFFLH